MEHQTFWIIFLAIIFVVLVLDLGVFQHRDHVMSIKEATLKTLLYISLALGFNLALWLKEGHEQGMQFLAGYLMELSLSIDNLFVFILIFSYFKIPAIYQNRVLFWGILGAIVFRGIFIAIGATLMSQFHWIIYVFGGFLIFTAFKMAFQKHTEPDPEMNIFIRLLKKIIPVTNEFQGHNFFLKKGKKHYATPLFLALSLIEVTDVIFAFDSIPAIFAITTDTFIVFTSNIFAIVGLRALYFCISGLIEKFIYLRPALCVVLAFVGIKMVISDYYEVPIEISLMFILMTLISAGSASFYKTKKLSKK